MTRLSQLAPVLALGAALAGPLTDARAGLLPTSVTVTPEGGKFRWTYAIVLPTDGHFRQDGRSVRSFSVRQTVDSLRSLQALRARGRALRERSWGLLSAQPAPPPSPP